MFFEPPAEGETFGKVNLPNVQGLIFRYDPRRRIIEIKRQGKIHLIPMNELDSLAKQFASAHERLSRTQGEAAHGCNTECTTRT